MYWLPLRDAQCLENGREENLLHPFLPFYFKHVIIIPNLEEQNLMIGERIKRTRMLSEHERKG